MRTLERKAESLKIGWNERPLDEAGFYRLCRRFRISVAEMPLATGGFYYRVKGRDFVAIDCRLTGVERLLVMYHELAHFLFHAPESGATANFHHVGRKTRVEREADAFALCCVIPRSWIETRLADDLLSTDDHISAQIFRERLALYETYGI